MNQWWFKWEQPSRLIALDALSQDCKTVWEGLRDVACLRTNFEVSKAHIILN